MHLLFKCSGLLSDNRKNLGVLFVDILKLKEKPLAVLAN
ncbi:hypothetical protein B6N60_01950 [Richelia sinica FACHB-800]|uniref:Uncharacterized protein n=1 Tax=Richelia sinica FACHB-800 TaxID=1357546 RepID=A0A975T8D6_9NOST|nr:hypothetical protein B6N60_01950 [Richelia sinica FACHB-800]